MSSRERLETVFVLAVVITGMGYIAGRTVDRVSYYAYNATRTTFQQEFKQMRWENLLFTTTLYQSDARRYLPDSAWKAFRETLQNLSPAKQYLALERWIVEHEYSEAARFQVSYHVYQSKRRGEITE